MKRMFLVFSLLTGILWVNFTQAQVNVNVSFNVNAQPDWGPSGYDNVNYYYMPDIETYYYVPKHQFIYLSGGNWVFAASLPYRYRSYDLYRGYKVVINEPRPYYHHANYKTRYVHYCKYYDHQPALRDHRGKNHGQWDDAPGNGHGNGHAYGHDKKEHGHGDHDK